MFFTPGHANDEEYITLCDEPQFSKDKARIEQFWTIHEPYADPHFLTDAKEQLHPRLWEMILTNTFKNRGYSLSKTSNDGPEFFIELSGKRFWVEAIAPGPGTGEDIIHPPKKDDPFNAQKIPEEKIILRLTNAVDVKLKKYEEDKQKGRIRAEDGFILAINGFKAVNGWGVGTNGLPYIVKAVLSLGPEYVSWDTKSLQVVDSGYEYRPEISKKSGESVSTSWMDMEEFKGVSAIIYSKCDILNLPKNMGSEFIFIRNHLANHPICLNTFEFGRHYWLEEDQLLTKAYP